MRAAERMPAPTVGLPKCPETLCTREQSAPRMILNADPRGSGSDSISTTSGLLQQREPAGRRAPICGRGQFVKPASAHLCTEGGFEDAILLVGRDNVGLLYPTPRQRCECQMTRAGLQHPRDLVSVSACACLPPLWGSRRRRVRAISPTTRVVTIGKTIGRVRRRHRSRPMWIQPHVRRATETIARRSASTG